MGARKWARKYWCRLGHIPRHRKYAATRIQRDIYELLVSSRIPGELGPPTQVGAGRTDESRRMSRAPRVARPADSPPDSSVRKWSRARRMPNHGGPDPRQRPPHAGATLRGRRPRRRATHTPGCARCVRAPVGALCHGGRSPHHPPGGGDRSVTVTPWAGAQRTSSVVIRSAPAPLSY